MAAYDQIQIRYNPVRTYPGTVQNNYVGAQTVAGRRGTLPTFTDVNAKYFASTGDDAAAGTLAAPYETIQFALDNLAGAFRYAVGKDSATYRERPIINYGGAASGGLYALDGQAPTIDYGRGADEDSCGARETGRTKFSAGAYPGTFYFISKAGNDGTGARGNPALPFLTLQGALADGARAAGDTFQYDDSGLYNDGAVAVAVNAATIQAKDGETPTIQAGNVGDLFAISIACNLYGLTFLGYKGGATSALVDLANTAGAFECYDCTFLHQLEGIEAHLTFDGTMDVRNCYFYLQNLYGVFVSADVNRAVGFQNCIFNQISGNRYLGVQTAMMFSKPGAGATITLTIEDCSFFDCDGEANIYFLISTQSTAGTTVVRSCLFRHDNPNKEPTDGIYMNSVDAGTTMLVENCLFDKLGGSAIREMDNFTLPIARGPSVIGCVAKECACEEIADAVFHFARPRGVDFNSVACFGARNGSFRVEAPNNINEPVYMRHCVSINAGGYGYEFTGTAVGPPQITGVFEGNAEANSALAGFAHTGGVVYVITTRFVCIESGYLNPPAGANTLLHADPMFISTVVENENAAIFPSSPCINRGGDGEIFNIGLEYILAQVIGATSAFVIDGFNLVGDPNFTDGIEIAESGVASQVTVEHCTFMGLAVEGVALASDGVVKNCLFESLNGLGVNCRGVKGMVERNAGFQCKGAMIVVDGTSVDVVNNSSYGCSHGQYNLGSVGARDYKNNVYSASGQFDYEGDADQGYSAIGTLSEDASVSNGTRRNPLFRDVLAGDLRLQTVETGFLFNSPAKGLASPAGDAGAYDFTYTALNLAWTLVDFATGAGNPDTAYRNPTRYRRTVYLAKPTEGDFHDGDFYSDAQAFKPGHIFEWDTWAAMPTAQVLALKAIYETGAGECQISLNGGGAWIPVRVVRSQSFTYTELAGLSYSDTSVMTPVARIVFRESD